jgi:glycine/D-amino acid oxidase-like deaminating enzyme
VTESDVIVIGAGIIGAACAWQLAKRGQRVTLVDDGSRARRRQVWAIWCMDDDPAELALSAWLARWRELTPDAGKLRLARLRHAVAGGNAGACAGRKTAADGAIPGPSDMQTREQLAAREPLLTSRLSRRAVGARRWHRLRA